MHCARAVLCPPSEPLPPPPHTHTRTLTCTPIHNHARTPRRRLVHCTRAVLSALSELAQRFPHRLSARLAPPPPPPRSAFGLMHAAVRAGDPDAAAALAALEEVLGGHCSLLASGEGKSDSVHCAHHVSFLGL